MATTAKVATPSANPDPATLSARERIRLHVQRNIQQQAQQAQLQLQQPVLGGARRGQVQDISKVNPASRKRSISAEDAHSRGDGSPTWETNTPPSGLSIDVQPTKRSRGDLGEGLYDGNHSDDEYNEESRLRGPSPSPPRDMLTHHHNGDMDPAMNMGLFNPPVDEGVDDTEAAGSRGLGLCDSPPCEVSWNGSDTHHPEPVADQSLNVDQSLNASGSLAVPVDEDWVKGLYDMEGME